MQCHTRVWVSTRIITNLRSMALNSLLSILSAGVEVRFEAPLHINEGVAGGLAPFQKFNVLHYPSLTNIIRKIDQMIAQHSVKKAVPLTPCFQRFYSLLIIPPLFDHLFLHFCCDTPKWHQCCTWYRQALKKSQTHLEKHSLFHSHFEPFL